MLLQIADLIQPADLDALLETAAKAAFEDGKATAGYAAREVKSNEQMAPGAKSDMVRSIVRKALTAHPLFNAFAQPESINRILVSRYRDGMEYGAHVDNALMAGKRADLSFTLFLSAPDQYEGGELVLETTAGETAVKMPAGGAIIYPTGALHRVAPVTSGERLAVVGWVRSLVRRADQRDILFDLDQAAKALYARDGKTAEFDLLVKSKTNLLRMWAED